MPGKLSSFASTHATQNMAMTSDTCSRPIVSSVLCRHGKNLNSDAWKAQQLWRHTCNPEHPCHRFSSGNKDTLLTDPKAQGIDTLARVSVPSHCWVLPFGWPFGNPAGDAFGHLSHPSLQALMFLVPCVRSSGPCTVMRHCHVVVAKQTALPCIFFNHTRHPKLRLGTAQIDPPAVCADL